jgi:hypothetical protein
MPFSARDLLNELKRRRAHHDPVQWIPAHADRNGRAARIRLEIDAGRQGPDVQAAAGVDAVVISVFSTKCCSYPRTGRMGAVVFGFRAAGIDHAKSPDK